MDGSITCRVNPNQITVTNEEILNFALIQLEETDVVFYNEHNYTAEDIPDISIRKAVDGLDFFLLYFDYGTRPGDLTEWGDGPLIQQSLLYEGWAIQKCSDPAVGTYWKLYPEQTQVWKSGGKASNAQEVVKFSQVKCNAAIGVTQMHIRFNTEELTPVNIWKLEMPVINRFAPSSAEPCYIGEDGVLQFEVPDHNLFKIQLDGGEVHPDKDMHEEKRKIRYGDYTLTVTNKAGYSVSKRTRFPLNIICSFTLESLTPEKATFSWKVESRNADKWWLKQIAENIPAVGDSQAFPTATMEDRTFELLAAVKGCSQTVTESIDVQIPVITSFYEGTDGTVRDCSRLLSGLNMDGFLPVELVLPVQNRQAVCVPFVENCKGGGTSYSHSYSWSGEHVTNYRVHVDGGGTSQLLPSTQLQVTISCQSRAGDATLEAIGAYGYTVTRHT